eukprot:gene9831-11644_t
MIREANAGEPAMQRWNITLTCKPTEWVRKTKPSNREANQQTQERELEDMLELEREVDEDIEQDPRGGEEDDMLMEMVERTDAWLDKHLKDLV